jgi:MFS family permease
MKASIFMSTETETGSAKAGLTPFGFAILLSAVLSVSMAYGVTLPVLPFLLERIVGPGDAVSWHTGMLTGLYMFALFLMSPVWGALSDRFDRRAIIATGLVGSSAGLFLLDNAASLTALYVARALSGALAAAVLPAALAYVAETAKATERPRKFAIVASATTLGFMLGPVLGSWLSPMIISPPEGMRLAGGVMLDSPFFAVALIGLLPALGTLHLSSLLRDRRNAPLDGTKTEKMRIRQGLLLTLMTVFGISAAEVGVTLLGKQSLFLGPREISQFFLICSATMIAVQLGIFPFLIKIFRVRTLLVSAFIPVSLGVGLIPYAGSVMKINFLFGLIAAGVGILIPVLAALISEAAGAEQGKALGQQTSSANLGQAFAAAVTGALYLVTPATPFLAASLVLAAGTVIAART